MGKIRYASLQVPSVYIRCGCLAAIGFHPSSKIVDLLVTLPVYFKVACLFFLSFFLLKETNDTIKVHCLVSSSVMDTQLDPAPFGWVSGKNKNSKVLTAVRSKFICMRGSLWLWTGRQKTIRGTTLHTHTHTPCQIEMPSCVTHSIEMEHTVVQESSAVRTALHTQGRECLSLSSQVSARRLSILFFFFQCGSFSSIATRIGWKCAP